MASISGMPRTEVELRAIAEALSLTGGAAPRWLGSELRRPGAIRTAPRPDPDAYRVHMAAALSVGGLLAAFLGCVGVAGDIVFAAPSLPAPRPLADPDALEAIALVQDWRPAGDDKAVLERLGAAVRNPRYPRAWSAERLEGDSYLVLFREPAGTPVYAFEVDLESEAVQASPEAVERLTRLRVREAAQAQLGLLARAP
jgi:hypothetical protein